MSAVRLKGLHTHLSPEGRASLEDHALVIRLEARDLPGCAARMPQQWAGDRLPAEPFLDAPVERDEAATPPAAARAVPRRIRLGGDAGVALLACARVLAGGTMPRMPVEPAGA